MAPRISHDARLRAIALLLLPAFVGHFIQLLSEDTPWTAFARARYWWTPGWHLALPPALIWALFIGLGIAVLGMVLRGTRPWALAVCGLYVAHYLTYPYRIRNHMTLMLSCLVVIGGGWLLGSASGAVDLRGRGPRSRLVDRHIAEGVALVLCITYFFAALHKTNPDFLALDPLRSAAVRGVDDFFLYGDLPYPAPRAARLIATYGTLLVEYTFPLLAWRSVHLRIWLVIGLLLFHFPHVAVMNVADYPMLASAFYPALFSAGHWRLLERRLRRPSRWNLGGVVLGVAAQLWFLPWWGGLTIFGIFVAGLWGYAAGSMLEMARWGGKR